MLTIQRCDRCQNGFAVDINPGVKREEVRHAGCPARPSRLQAFAWAMGIVALIIWISWIAAIAESQETKHCPTMADMPKPGTCHFTDDGTGSCAPGELDPDIMALDEALQINALCKKGGTQAARCKLSTPEREALFLAYSLSWPPPPKFANGESAYEVDHKIQEALGGAQTMRNLWPQMAEPRPGYQEKDRLEDYLHREVCAGRMTLSAARSTLLSDWKAAYAKMKASP